MILFLHFLQSHFVEAIHTPSSKKWPPKERLLTDIPLLFFDTETTGYYPEKGDRVISIGAVKWEPGTLRESEHFYRLVNPERAIPMQIEKLTGISEKMVQREPAIEKVLVDFLNWSGEAVAVGHAVHFDVRFLEPITKKVMKTRFPLPLADTKKLAHLLYPSLPSYSLEALAEHLSLPMIRRHHALEDARLTGELFRALLHQLREKGVYTWGDLLTFLKLREHPLMQGKGGTH